MGVTGLWKLIDQSGKEILIDNLENKVLAIDISIWLHQVIKGFQDKKGNALQNAHLLGLFNRLCKLLYYRIKPVFVFDGSVPALKRDTIAKRQHGRTKILKEVERIQELLMDAMTKEKILQKAIDPNKLENVNIQKNNMGEDGVFIIPDYLSPAKAKDETLSSDCNTSISENDSFDDSNLQHYYNINLQNIDVMSAHFKTLPADVRLEILGDIREMRKQNSWGRLHEMPTKSDNFSEFQMKRLLKRRQVQVCLEEAEKELEGRCLTLNELETFLSEQGIVTAEKNAKTRVNSDVNTRFLLVKDLKKAIEKAAKQELLKSEPTDETITTNQIDFVEKNDKNVKDNNECQRLQANTSFEILDEEDDQNDEELQLAIQLSLNQSNVYNDKDYLASKATLNKEQISMFKQATGSARDYLLKYGLIKNLNLDDIDESEMDNTSQDSELLNSIKHNKSLMADLIDKKLKQLEVEDEPNKKMIKMNISENESSNVRKKDESFSIISDDSDSDIDFIEVNEPISSVKKDKLPEKETEKIQIYFDPRKSVKPEEDLFADIFTEKIEELSSNTTTAPLIQKMSDQEISSYTGKQIIQTNQEVILENLKKEASEVLKLTIDDLKLENSVIEIPDSQQSLCSTEVDSGLSNNNHLVIEIKDSQVSLNSNRKNEDLANQPQHIEVPDSQEVQIQNIPSQEISQTTYMPSNSIEIVLSPLIVPDSQENLSSQEVITNKDDHSVIEILNSQHSEKEASVCPEVPTEVIEILDDSPMSGNKTPSKLKIQNFFKTEYIIKKTPTKNEEGDESIPKIPSPFFVKKTPSSSNKKKLLKSEEKSEENSTSKRSSKVSKALFDDNIENNEKQKQDSEIVAITKASETLRNDKSKEELENMVTEIDKEKKELEKERNRQDRMGLSITEKMTRDCMDLLKLFGIPYVIAPMEAEAQCAFLEVIELTDGTITDDSDIWLFGGRTVYKNFFDKQKYVLEFQIDQIQRDFHLTREKLIQLAFLVGSDYTIGIKGIGTVTALEILAAFPSTPAIENETSKIMSLLSSLRKFRDWFRNTKNGGTNEVKVKLKSKLKNIEVGEGFPNLAIAEAYLYPNVDDSKEPFTWGTPDIETIRKFTRKNFGWTQIKTDETLGPVLKRMEQKKSQTSIKSFFAVKSSTQNRDLKMSKRVEKAVRKMSTNYNSEEDDKVNELKQNEKPKRNLKRKNATDVSEKVVNTSIKSKKASGCKNKLRNESSELIKAGPSTLIKVFQENTEKAEKTELEKKICIPQTKQVIPQREQDIVEMNKKKEIASALFKRTRLAEKKKKN